MGKAPVPRPTNWTKMTEAEKMKYVDENFLAPVRRNERMIGYLSAALGIFLSSYL